MENSKNILDNILEIIGVISITVVASHLIESVLKKTETSVISNQALEAIQDPEKAEKLREQVDKYHQTGNWDTEKLETIL